MKNKLKPCPACGKEIAKSATACPQCGKKFSSAAGLILAVMIGLIGAWLIAGKSCAQAADLNERSNEIEDQLRAR
jgi:hypothetical protein